MVGYTTKRHNTTMNQYDLRNLHIAEMISRLFPVYLAALAGIFLQQYIKTVGPYGPKP